MSNMFNCLGMDEEIDERPKIPQIPQSRKIDPFSKDYERLKGKESWADYMDLMDNPKKKLIPIPLFRSKANN